MKLKKIALLCTVLVTLQAHAFINEKFVFPNRQDHSDFQLANNGIPVPVISDDNDFKGVLRAVDNLKNDLQEVTGNQPATHGTLALIVCTVGKSKIIDQLVQQNKIPANEIKGKYEKYIITVVEQPTPDVSQALVIAGSDKRGTIYGVYELAQQIGVSPWHYWADVPVNKADNLFVKVGSYSEGEPAVHLRGIFINDEAPAFQGP